MKQNMNRGHHLKDLYSHHELGLCQKVLEGYLMMSAWKLLSEKNTPDDHWTSIIRIKRFEVSI